MSGKTLNIRLPFYTLGEEIFNAVSHGIGAAFSIPALVMMTLRAHGGLPAVSVCLFGVSMIMLYTVSPGHDRQESYVSFCLYREQV